MNYLLESLSVYVVNTKRDRTIKKIICSKILIRYAESGYISIKLYVLGFLYRYKLAKWYFNTILIRE